MMLRATVCVLGGGPSGSSVALRLAQLGHSVIVVEKKLFPSAHIGESLSPGVLPLLETLGLRHEVEQQDFLRPDRALILWPPSHGYKSLGPVPGFQVDRCRFDSLLLSAAARHGAKILSGATVEAMHRSQAGWRLHVQWQHRRCILDCCFLVDATGRESAIPGKKRRVYGKPAFALYGYWDKVGLTGPETRVEAGEDEWFWGAPLPDGRYVATVFLDPKRLRRTNGRNPPAQLYLALLRRSNLLQACLKGQLQGKVRACDASCFYDQRPVTTNSIRVGEASLAVDPLSSQGVQLAMGSGVHAAAVIHTSLLRPESSALARRFYRDRQRESLAFHHAAAAGLYEQVACERPAAFWQSRARPRLSAVQAQDISLDLSPCQKIRLDRQAKIVDVPCLTGDFVGLVQGVSHPRLKRPVVFLGDVAVGPLLKHLRNPQMPDQLLRIWSGLVSGNGAAKILAWLWTKGIITEAGGH